MSQPLPAHTVNEAQYYLMVRPCAACGKGPWAFDPPAPPATGETIRIAGCCRNCSAEETFEFQCSHAIGAGGGESLTINPTGEPSRIIDLGQWLSLFYLLVESAATDTSPAVTRRTGYQAAMCLDEALKFYGDNELPPESAFFSPATQAAFREHPEKFARQRLRDMQAKLPSLSAMVRRLDRDEQSTRRRWWRFWRR